VSVVVSDTSRPARFLLDTNVLSELVKRTVDLKVHARLQSEPSSSLFISSVTVFELRYGAARSAKPASLWARIQREIIDRFQSLPFDSNDARAAADVMSALAGSGYRGALQDIWLAGVATNRGLTLVTRNVRPFDRILNLRVENWFD
jgi:predicted nucleic acid-binding protein